MNAQQNQKILNRGEELFNTLGGSGKSIFNKDWWYGKIMDWSLQNPDFKTQMFRFVDVLPMLESGKDVSKHLKEYFAEADGKLPSIFNLGLGMGALAPNVMAGTIKKNVTQMAKLFIAGETANDALKKLKEARKKNMAFTVDILGEACLSEAEAQDYLEQYLQLIDDLARETQGWKANPQIDEDHLGPIPTVNVSVKITSIFSQIHTEAWEASKEDVKARLRPILDKAMTNFVFINIDMEKFAVKDLTLEVFKDLLMEEKYKDYRHFGIVIQAYLRDSLRDTKDLVEFAKERGTPFSVRLVKGAYWDYETIGALQKNWPIPVYSDKRESDANYEDCTDVLLGNSHLISTAIASHNVRSIAHALVVAEEQGIDPRSMEIQMLYGMAEPFKQSILQKRIRLREYCPVGDLLPGMSYLVRRLLENTSNQSFLKSKFADGTDNQKLLADPKEGLVATPAKPPARPGAFVNEDLQNFSFHTPREKLSQALSEFKAQHLGKTWTSSVNNQSIDGAETLPIINPSDETSLGSLSLASAETAHQAVGDAKEAFATWRLTPVEERAALIEKVADILVRDKFKLMACEILEAGKTWHEADGDVCEAIDFCRYYAKDMRRLGAPKRVGEAPGEYSAYEYIPRGVNAIIAPWNFPLAILTGMVAGAVVTGNTVVMKPAEQTPIIADFLMAAFREAGCPPGVVNLLQGRGEVVGEALVVHKDVVMIGFTGSKDVGLNILSKASVVHPGQSHIKRCLTELGGKNAIIVDSDADMDEAVAGVAYSAFGFQGQKCSACSRVIVLEGCHDKFVERLIEATKSLHMGPTENPRSAVGPVIDKDSYERIQKYIQIAQQEGRVHSVEPTEDKGYFISPTVVTGISPEDRLAHEEIFGPVLAVIKVKTFEEAIAVANGTDYALTAAVYSRSPLHIEKARKEIMVGNLYINRGSTAALVDRHPFGGFKLSGGGSKTGGPDYLLEFMDPRVVTENTLRRGFSPDLVN